MRFRYLSSALALVTACGGSHYKREVIGGGTAAVNVRSALAPAPASAPAVASTMALGRGDYEVVLRFDVPRAQIVDWTVACAGAEQRGSLGETFDAYRERRIAQLRADREREHRNTAALTGAVIGAVAPDVHARAQATGPNATASADATVSGTAVGAAAGTAIADATVSTVVDLPPGDVGATQLRTRVALTTAADGPCTVSAVADDPNVLATFDIVHVRDLRAEARARQTVVNTQAHEVRGQLHAQLVAFGADATLRQRTLEAAARARAEADARRRLQAEADARVRAERQAKLDAELQLRADANARVRAERQAKLDAELQLRANADARVRAEQQAKLDAELQLRAEADARVRAKAELEAQAKLSIEVRLREGALRTRGELYAYLTGQCNADPNHRQRIREERETRIRIEREQRDARLRIELEARAERERIAREKREARLRIELEARETRLRAERERQFAIQAANARRLEVALTTRTALRAYLVALGARERPPMPAPLFEQPGNAPFSGAVWVAGTWRWNGGQWSWEAGGWRDETVFGAAGSTGRVEASTDYSLPVSIEIGGTAGVSVGGNASSSTVRDHRTPTPAPTPSVRDHRSEPTPAPTVRDHRSEPVKAEPKPPVVRDHRSEPTNAETKTPIVRDHRKADEDKQDSERKSDKGPKVRDHRR